MGVSPQGGRALMASAAEPPEVSQPCGLGALTRGEGDAAQPPACGLPQKRCQSASRMAMQKAAPLAQSPCGRWSVATPGAPAGRRSAEGIFIHCRPVPSPSNPAPFPDDTPLKKDSNDSASPQSSPGPRYARLRLLGRPLLSFLKRVFPPDGEGLMDWAGRKMKEKTPSAE